MDRARLFLWSAFLGTGGVTALLAWWAAQRLIVVDSGAARLLGLAGLGGILLTAFLALLLDRRFLLPPRALARQLELRLEQRGEVPDLP
ncbi:MAG TPA: hypothetical protein ENJ83_04965, partial [Rhodospirillales bacterium]|nr:hypothetical protein [Rhodospirillales bacterium]